MTQGTRIGSVVMFVQDLDRSVGFYQELLELEVADQSPTAALLTSVNGTQLILRAMGSGVHSLGGVGVQYVIWTASGKGRVSRSTTRPARARPPVPTRSWCIWTRRRAPTR